MDELDSNFPLFLLHSDEQHSFQLLYEESLLQHKEQTVIDTHHQESQSQDEDVTMQKKRNRDDNTVFKTPLSELRKIMKEQLKYNHQCIDLMTQINKKKNSASFLKFLLLAQKLGIKSKVKEMFQQKMEKILVKKKDKLPEKRFSELQKVYGRMKSSFECVKISDAMHQYWGAYRQKTKFQKSYKEIQTFEIFLETIDYNKEKNHQQKITSQTTSTYK